MRLTLPYPPGVNALYRSVAMIGRKTLAKIVALVRVNGVAWLPAHPVKSKVYREYEGKAHAALARGGVRADPSFGKGVEVAVTARLYRPRRAGDIDGPVKALFDVMNGWVWEDDSQVSELHLFKDLDRANPRVEVEITAVTTKGADTDGDDSGDVEPPEDGGGDGGGDGQGEASDPL